MRIIIALAAVVPFLAVPATAQDRRPAPTGDVVRHLSDPMVADAAAAAVSAIADIVLDTRVGPLARYSDGRIRPSDTLRDVERRRDPQFEARLHDSTRRAVRTAGVVAGDGAAMAGELRVTMARLNDALAPFVDYAARSAGRYRDRDRDDDY